MPAISLSQLESHLWEAAWVLKGPRRCCGAFKILFTNAVNEVTRERAQSFLTDEHLQSVVRAYQNFNDEPGFTRVVPIEEIRTKEGNLSIPLYVGGETLTQTDAATESSASALPDALTAWLESSCNVRHSLQTLITASAK